MESIYKKALKKLIIAIVLTIVFIVFYSYFSNRSNNDSNFTFNSGGINMKLNISNYYMRDIDKFFLDVENKNYSEAYNLLSDECKKEKFLNSQEKFEDDIKEIINNDICQKKIMYENLTKEKEKGKKIYLVNGIVYFEKFSEGFKDDVNSDKWQEFFSVKKFTFKVYENKPFDFKYYLSLE